MNIPKHARVSALRQGLPDPQTPTLVSFEVNRLAREERQRLFNGLERFANASDSIDDYRALSKGWSGFWPRQLLDRHGKSLAWTDDCHDLFLVFRNQLRYVWTPLPDALKRGAVSFLLGIGEEFERLEGGAPIFLACPGLNEAWGKITKYAPSGSDTSRPPIHPQWTSGNLTYLPRNEFQRALYLLFRESWRAKVCSKCSTYFVASKPAQLYCGTSCSGGVKRERTLQWWRDKGAKRRATLTKSGRKPDGVIPRGRTKR